MKIPIPGVNSIFIARDISALFGLKILNLHLRVQICQGELKDDKVKFERSNHLDKNKIYELKRKLVE